MSDPTITQGLAVASGVTQRIGWHLDEHPDSNLADLAAVIGDVDDTKAVLRVALAYMAAQLKAERRTSDQAKAGHMILALGSVAGTIDRLRAQGVLE